MLSVSTLARLGFSQRTSEYGVNVVFMNKMCETNIVSKTCGDVVISVAALVSNEVMINSLIAVAFCYESN